MHRLMVVVVLCSCATQSPARPLSVKAEPERPRAQPPQLVVTGQIEAAASDVDALVHAVRARVQEAGGHVMNEEVSGTARDTPRATLRLRLPAPEVAPLCDWLATHSQVLARHLGAQDVAREYLDEELALHNLRTTLDRLEEIAAQDGKLADVLEIEREMNRVRGEIERLEGSHRALGDQVALATVDLSIAAADEALAPRAMFQLMPSAGVLALAEPRGRRGLRAGAGLTLMFSRHAALELQLFAGAPGEGRSALVTLHTGAYSDFFGGGRRRFLNPHLGLFAGGGALDGDGAFTTGASFGVELYRGPRLLVDLATRAQLLLYGDGGPPSELAVQGALSAGVPF
jgi:hypothetical protein